jgi:hypothetical protein
MPPSPSFFSSAIGDEMVASPIFKSPTFKSPTFRVPDEEGEQYILLEFTASSAALAKRWEWVGMSGNEWECSGHGV